MVRGCIPGYLDNRKENMLIFSARWRAGAYLEPGGVDVVAALNTRPGREGNSRHLWRNYVVKLFHGSPNIFFNVPGIPFFRIQDSDLLGADTDPDPLWILILN